MLYSRAEVAGRKLHSDYPLRKSEPEPKPGTYTGSSTHTVADINYLVRPYLMYDAYGVQNILLLYADSRGVQNIVLLNADSCTRVIFGPLRCVRVQIPVTFLLYFVREMICMHTIPKTNQGGPFVFGLHTNVRVQIFLVRRFPRKI